MLRRFVSAGLRVIAALIFTASAWSATPMLLRNPSLSQDKIAFLYADDIWTVARAGGEARRLTSVGTVSAGPFYSPNFLTAAPGADRGQETLGRYNDF
jgi:tricorn protease